MLDFTRIFYGHPKHIAHGMRPLPQAKGQVRDCAALGFAAGADIFSIGERRHSYLAVETWTAAKRSGLVRNLVRCQRERL